MSSAAAAAPAPLSSSPRRGLPVLDMRTYEHDRPAFVQALAAACDPKAGGVGFFLLRHRLPAGLASRLLAESRHFFDQASDAQKEDISYAHSPAFRGYMAMGAENTAGATDMREQIEYAVEYGVDPYPSNHGKSDSALDEDRQRPYYERLRASENPWPHIFQPTLRPTTLEYIDHVNRIATVIRQCFCRALGLAEDSLDDVFDPHNRHHPPHWVLKLLSYPPTDSGFGVGEHVDSNYLTLILQDAPGLQVWVQGEWVPIPHTHQTDDKEEDAYLIVNLGEQAQVLSNGVFAATPHRVLPHPSSPLARPRTSLALFSNPSLRTTIAPLPVVLPSSSSTARATNAWVWDRPNRIMGTVGENTFKSLARSHPHVLRQHHADLALQPDGSLLRRPPAATAAE
jgi:isopenicillin N synthase-like dioxygenase